MEFGTKEKNRKMIYGGVFLILLGALLIFMGYREVNSAESGTGILKQTVYIGEGPMVDANEGKTIIIMGKMKAKRTIFDTEAGISIDSVCAYRKVEYLEWVESHEDDDENTRNKFVWKTVSRGSSRHKLPSDYLYGVASINGTVIDDSILRSITREKNYDGFKASELKKSSWKYVKDPEGHAFLSIAPDAFTRNGTDFLEQCEAAEKLYEGQIRVSYDYLNLSEAADDGYFTIIGIQSGNTISRNPDLSISAFKGKVGFTEVAEREMSATKNRGRYLFYIASVIFVLGVCLIYKGRRYY